MRDIVLLFATFVCCIPSPLRSQTIGTYQSSLDNLEYEFRQRGYSGLDIYASNGAVVATLDKKKASDRVFKGQTQRLATNCPTGAGKIEILSVTPERIQARVEVPSKNLNNESACNMLFLNHWQNFDLVKASSGGGGGHGGGDNTSSNAPGSDNSQVNGATVTGTGSANATKMERNGIRFELDGCSREDQRIVCKVAVTNISGSDLDLYTGATCIGNGGFFIDQLGNKVVPSRVLLGNVEVGCGTALIIPDLRMPMQIIFENTNSQAKEIVRLSITMKNEKGQMDVQFGHIPVVDADAAATPPGNSQHSDNGFSVTRNDVRYQLRECRHQSQDLVCRIDVLNASADHHLNWNPSQTYVIDDSGNRLQATDIKLGNKPIQESGLLSANAQVPMTIDFTGLASGAKKLARLEVGGFDGAPVTFRFSGIDIQD